MSKYTIYFEYLEPRVGEITLDAEGSDDAAFEAMKEIERNFPEAIEIEVVKVTEL